MLKGVISVAAVIAALMFAIRDGRLLRTTGLTATCTVVQNDATGTQLEACRAGKLEGRPDLSHRGCTDVGGTGPYKYWRCPAPLVASQVGR